MKRLYERAAALIRPNGLEIGQGADPRVVRALRLAAEELRVRAEYANGGHGPTVKVASFDEVIADALKVVRRHVWREVLGEDI
jgi:hypothetical protein